MMQLFNAQEDQPLLNRKFELTLVKVACPRSYHNAAQKDFDPFERKGYIFYILL